MCGRFGLFSDPPTIAECFNLPEVPELRPRYNIAPTQPGPTVGERPDTHRRSYAEIRWGLIPFWSDGPDHFSSDLINARGETVAEKPAFRKQFYKQRCVVPASGFYEWKKTNGTKQPHWIHPADEPLFGFAGLWDIWRDDETGERVQSFTIITTGANEKIGKLHDRMPVILSPDEYDTWLDTDCSDRDTLEPMLDPYPPEKTNHHPVSTAVNNPSFDDPECVESLHADNGK